MMLEPCRRFLWSKPFCPDFSSTGRALLLAKSGGSLPAAEVDDVPKSAKKVGLGGRRRKFLARADFRTLFCPPLQRVLFDGTYHGHPKG